MSCEFCSTNGVDTLCQCCGCWYCEHDEGEQYPEGADRDNYSCCPVCGTDSLQEDV